LQRKPAPSEFCPVSGGPNMEPPVRAASSMITFHGEAF